MKSLHFLAALAILISASNGISKDVTEPKIEPSFRIYLVDEEVNILDKTILKKIDEIKLCKEPLISEKDIKAYRWESHTIELTKESVDRFKKMIVHGKPDGLDVEKKVLWEKGMNKVFIVVVNGRRAYLGTTTSVISSFIGPFPRIDVSFVDAEKVNGDMPANSIRIQRATKKEDEEEDVREQEWIKAALEELKILK
jgi:hypothetical protein